MQKVRWAGYLLVLIFAVALGVSHFWKSTHGPRFHGLDVSGVPMIIDGYQGSPASVDAATVKVLSTAQIASRLYTDAAGHSVGLFLIGGTNRDALHDPRSCLTGSGGTINDDHVETLALEPAAAHGGIPVRACVVTYPRGSQYGSGDDILYFYVSDRRVIASATEIRLALLRALVEQNGDPVYFIRIVTRYEPGQDYAAEHARLVRFATAFWKSSAPVFLEEDQT